VSHFTFTVLVSILLSVALAWMGNRTPQERAYAATYLFLCFALATVAGGWAMYLIHR
jgi:hypothetical protein